MLMSYCNVMTAALRESLYWLTCSSRAVFASACTEAEAEDGKRCSQTSINQSIRALVEEVESKQMNEAVKR